MISILRFTPVLTQNMPKEAGRFCRVKLWSGPCQGSLDLVARAGVSSLAAGRQMLQAARGKSLNRLSMHRPRKQVEIADGVFSR